MSEESLLVPNSHYAVFKASATLYCQYEAKSKNLPIPTLRPFHVYGPYEEPSRLIPTLIRQFSNGISPKLVSPNISRDLIYIDDVIDYYILSCTNRKINGEILNLGSGKNTNLKKIYSTINLYLKTSIEPQWNSMASRKWDQNIWVANIDKTVTLFREKKNIDLKKGISKFIEWHKRNYKIYEKLKIRR